MRLGIIKKSFPISILPHVAASFVFAEVKRISRNFGIRSAGSCTIWKNTARSATPTCRVLLLSLSLWETTTCPTQAIPEDVIVHGPNGHLVKARTPNQKKMLAMADRDDIIFAIGPAGTGKTYTAVAKGLQYVLKINW